MAASLTFPSTATEGTATKSEPIAWITMSLAGNAFSRLGRANDTALGGPTRVITCKIRVSIVGP